MSKHTIFSVSSADAYWPNSSSSPNLHTYTLTYHTPSYIIHTHTHMLLTSSLVYILGPRPFTVVTARREVGILRLLVLRAPSNLFKLSKSSSQLLFCVEKATHSSHSEAGVRSWSHDKSLTREQRKRRSYHYMKILPQTFLKVLQFLTKSVMKM